jgi:hypothetical protein
MYFFKQSSDDDYLRTEVFSEPSRLRFNFRVILHLLVKFSNGIARVFLKNLALNLFLHFFLVLPFGLLARSLFDSLFIFNYQFFCFTFHVAFSWPFFCIFFNFI